MNTTINLFFLYKTYIYIICEQYEQLYIKVFLFLKKYIY
ncbi:hypothetical protein XBO1_2290025 [Xenorhabdus bovienii str. oregonense]|uniref:Uncharacterized protein n=1 Tax=Xenorhabdus bovienii str. oregonense TaxID=1398202 RepID=A0A077P7H6_XENBV|nr:hypothetical protein XBO1_2290025 [Xenorhabdus bovienii str. oregonense]